MVEKLEMKLKTKQQKIETLEAELKAQQDREAEHRQEDFNLLASWMSEAMRLRRLSESLNEDLMKYKARAEKAERKVRNLKLWARLSGEGAGDGPDTN